MILRIFKISRKKYIFESNHLLIKEEILEFKWGLEDALILKLPFPSWIIQKRFILAPWLCFLMKKIKGPKSSLQQQPNANQHHGKTIKSLIARLNSHYWNQTLEFRFQKYTYLLFFLTLVDCNYSKLSNSMTLSGY